MTSPTGHQDLVNFSGWKYYMLMRVCCQHHCWKNMVLSIWIHWERVNRNKYFPYPEPYKSESEVALMCPTLCDPGPTRFFRPWDFPGNNTGVGCHFLRKGTFLTQGSNPALLHCRQILYHLSHQGSPSSTHAAKSLQSCPTLCNPRDGSPPGSSVLGILQARTLEWVLHMVVCIC